MNTIVSIFARYIFIIYAFLFFAALVLDANAVTTGLSLCNSSFTNTGLLTFIRENQLSLTCSSGAYSLTHSLTHLLTYLLSHRWMDDWISLVYGKERTFKARDATVIHHTGAHGQRYEVDKTHEQLLMKVCSLTHSLTHSLTNSLLYA